MKTYKEGSRLEEYARALNHYGYQVYDEEMPLRCLFDEKDRVVVEAHYNEDFDVFESSTAVKYVQSTKKYGDLLHYANLIISHYEDEAPIIRFMQKNPCLSQNFNISDFLTAIEIMNAPTIKEKQKILVFLHDQQDYLGFAGIVHKVNPYSSDLADLISEEKLFPHEEKDYIIL